MSNLMTMFVCFMDAAQKRCGENILFDNWF